MILCKSGEISHLDLVNLKCFLSLMRTINGKTNVPLNVPTNIAKVNFCLPLDFGVPLPHSPIEAIDYLSGYATGCAS